MNNILGKFAYLLYQGQLTRDDESPSVVHHKAHSVKTNYDAIEAALTREARRNDDLGTPLIKTLLNRGVASTMRSALRNVSDLELVVYTADLPRIYNSSTADVDIPLILQDSLNYAIRPYASSIASNVIELFNPDKPIPSAYKQLTRLELILYTYAWYDNITKTSDMLDRWIDLALATKVDNLINSLPIGSFL